MDGYRRWVALIVASVVAVGVMGVVATQLELSGAKERPCGTALRIDLGRPTLLRDHGYELKNGGDAPPEEYRHLLSTADELESRCKDRQALALLGLGAGGVFAASAVAWATYQIGRRAGRSEGRAGAGRNEGDVAPLAHSPTGE